MPSKHPYSTPGREGQPKPTFIEWPAKVLKAPKPSPQKKKK